MLVIIEGIDCTGKTTLARELEREHGFEYRHFGPPKSHPLIEYVGSLRDHAPVRNHVVLDRFHLGERVWPTIFTRTTLYDDAAHRYVEAFLLSRGAILVACTDSIVNLQRRLRERGDDALAIDDIPRAHDAFATTFAGSRLPKFWHKIKNPASVRAIVDAASVHAHDVADIITATCEYVGPREPEILLVGDRIGFSDTVESRIPFVPFAPFPRTSGAYLHRALATVDADWSLTNARVHDRRGRWHLEKLWYALGGPCIVALGNAAAKVLRNVRLPHGVVPHPQFIRRFHHARVEEYGCDIVQAATEMADRRKEWTCMS